VRGSVKKDIKTGNYYFVVDVGKDPVTGKRKQKKKRGFKTKKEAEIALNQFINEFVKGNYIEPTTLTLETFATEWFIERKLQVASNTLKNNWILYKYHIKPFLGHLKLQDINLIIIQRYINNLAENSTLTSSSIKKVITLLKVMLQKAVQLKILKENPVIGVTLPKEQKKEMNVWNLEQVNYFLNHSKRNRYYTAYLLAILTGMRKGEILGLRWKDVDLENGIIYVRQILDTSGKQFKAGAKTSAGVRTIHIPKILIEQLKKEQKKILKYKQKYSSEFNDNDLVICTRYGNPIDPPTLSKRFKEHTKKLGLPIIRFHDLRHTHATMLIQQNVNAKVISERLGHSSIHITLNQYSHVLPSMQKDVADRLDKLFK
jgi:integrase